MTVNAGVAVITADGFFGPAEMWFWWGAVISSRLRTLG